jgi:hypothetical protein
VWNGGFDGTGTHCSDNDAALPAVPNRVLNARLGEPLRLPETVSADGAAFGQHSGDVRVTSGGVWVAFGRVNEYFDLLVEKP